MRKMVFLILMFFCVFCIAGCSVQTNTTSKNMNSASSERLQRIKENYADTIKQANHSGTTYSYKDDVLKIDMR